MAGRPSTGQAVELLQAELETGRQALGGLDAEGAWRAFLRFAWLRFDLTDTPDADGLLFQYGTYAFDGPAVFMVDLTRQFEIADRQGDHDHFLQVHCELRFGAAPALLALGSFDSWFFHGGGGDLDEWAEAMSGREGWARIRTLKPAGIRVHQERV
ncbi:conserved hypothetical protein [Actinacidiphila bryophytorum]|uniref:Uncharacterized protein n=1 Tax=Actinacidiphila bryophytorum TaxID=1436133 RepID=A0A9W4H177_9ACTN|nr:conserved hypothetical protein [Actinacidiphila bryophytorum]